LLGTKETENYAVIYNRVNRYTRGQSGVMIWIYKSVSNKVVDSPVFHMCSLLFYDSNWF